MKFREWLNDKSFEKISKKIKKKIKKDPNEFIIDIPSGKMKSPENSTKQTFDEDSKCL